MVTKDEVRKIARLSKLNLSETELESLTKDLTEIVAFADTISETVDETGDFDNINGLENVFREDVVEESLPQEEILQNRSGGERGYFCVRKRM